MKVFLLYFIFLPLLCTPAKASPAFIENARDQFQYSLLHLESNLSEKDIRPGAVVASPSRENPNYFYHWIRDAALVMGAYETLSVESPSLADARLKSWLRFEVRLQSLPAPAGLGETRFNADGTLDTTPWMKPQNDGPALRAHTMILWAFDLLERHKKDFVTKNLTSEDGPIRKDLDYTVQHWNDPSFDVWEEVKGDHFFTRMAQMRALQLGSSLFSQIGDEKYASILSSAANKVLTSLNSFWSNEQELIMPSLNVTDGWMRKHTNLDLTVLLASLYLTHDSREAFSVMDDRVLSSVKKYHDSFSFYEINQGQHTWMLGRYPEDTYDGTSSNSKGNPWFLANTGYAQFLCRLAQNTSQIAEIRITKLNKNFWSDFTKSPLTVGDVLHNYDSRYNEVVNNLKLSAKNYFVEILRHVGENGSMSEQMSRYNGYMMGAQDLSWSHASYLTAYLECQSTLSLPHVLKY